MAALQHELPWKLGIFNSNFVCKKQFTSFSTWHLHTGNFPRPVFKLHYLIMAVIKAEACCTKRRLIIKIDWWRTICVLNHLETYRLNSKGSLIPIYIYIYIYITAFRRIFLERWSRNSPNLQSSEGQYCFHKNTSFNPTLSHQNPGHTLKTYILKIVGSQCEPPTAC